MFKILCDGVTICNSVIEESAVIEPIITEQVNTCGSLEFTIPPTHEKYDIFEQKKSIVEVYEDGELTFRGIVSSFNVDFFKQKKVVCEGELTYLNDSVQRPARYRNYNPTTYLQKLIEIHNAQVDSYKQFTVGTVTVTDSTNMFRYTNYNSTMQEIAEDLIDNYGGYIRLRRSNNINYIDYLKESVRMANQPIRLGVNMLDYQSNLDSLELCTRVIPLGETLDTQTVRGLDDKLTIALVNDGNDYLDSANISQFGVITKVVTWDDVTTPQALKTKGQKYLTEYQFANAVIEVNAFDLSAVDSGYNKIKVLDSVRIISDYHGLDSYFVLTKKEHHLCNPAQDVLSFGKVEKQSLSVKTIQQQASLEKQVKSISKSEILASALKSAQDKIAGASGGYVAIEDDEVTGKPSRILIMDTDNKLTAQHVIQINHEGIGFSNSGINGTFTSAWTIDGEFDAQWITAGVLQGIQIIAERGSVAGWTIDSDSMYADVVDSNGYTHRTYIQKPTSTNSWVFSVQKSTTNTGTPSLFNRLWYIDANGNMSMEGNLSIEGNANIEGNLDFVGDQVRIKETSSSTGYYTLPNYIRAVVAGIIT